MNASDAALLPTITTALTDLRDQGTPLNIDVTSVSMLVNGKTVRYNWDSVTSEWQISAQ